MVKEGDVIAVLDHKDIEAALAGARAALKRAKAELGENEVAIERAKKDLERTTKARENRAVSEADHDQAYFQHQPSGLFVVISELTAPATPPPGPPRVAERGTSVSANESGDGHSDVR